MSEKLSEKIQSTIGFADGFSPYQEWYKDAEALEQMVKPLEAENEKLRAICENVGELLSTMEDAHLQTAWHILDNACNSFLQLLVLGF